MLRFVRFVRSKNLRGMSRSRKRTPVSTNVRCKSQKKDKRICNRIFQDLIRSGDNIDFE